MVFCCVVGCHNKRGRDNTRFFSIPAIIKNQCDRAKELSTERRRLWLTRINRKNLTDKNITRDKAVCDRHFISGRPSRLFDNLSPDWAPSLALGHENYKNKAVAIDRYLRLKQRKKKQMESQDNRQEKNLLPENVNDESKENNLGCENYTSFENEVNVNHVYLPLEENETGEGCMTDISGEDMEKMTLEMEMTRKDNMYLRSENQELKSKLNYCIINQKTLEQDDDKVKFYTGLPSYFVLKTVFELVTDDMVPSLHSALSLFQEFLIVLMRMRLNLLEQDLAYRFGVSRSSISRYLSKWLPIMADRLRCFISWPDRETLQTSMPQRFKDAFGKNVCVIIDCFEIFINRASSLLPRAATWSQYKHHNTVKFLIGITPQGSVSFISKGWAGRTSDKEITENCGILDNLIKGDVVLADRGFNIADDIVFRYAKLVMPAFTKGKPQLSFEDVEETRKIANLRIHVERVIGLVRNKYHILQSTLPIETLMVREGETDAPIDHIVTIACALVNLCPSVVINLEELEEKS